MSHGNPSSFIDQNLAAQLFVASRAHDSLRQEPDRLLPSTITDIFASSTSKSNQYRNTTYSALAKSQQIPSHHGQQIVTEEKEDSSDEEQADDIAAALVMQAGNSLAEDMFNREHEELNILRTQYLTQLASTREKESKMEDLQQQLDRTKCVMMHPNSGDLMLLHHTAARLHLLRELTSRTFDDFFSARAQYSSWCRAQQNAYKGQAKKTLSEIKVKSEKNRAAQEEAIVRCRQFLKDVTTPDAISDISTQVKMTPSRRRLSLSQTLPSPQKGFSVPLDKSFEEFKDQAEEVLMRATHRNEQITAHYLAMSSSSSVITDNNPSTPSRGKSDRRESKHRHRQAEEEQKKQRHLRTVAEESKASPSTDLSGEVERYEPSISSHVTLGRPALSRVVRQKRKPSRRRKTTRAEVADKADGGVGTVTSIPFANIGVRPRVSAAIRGGREMPAETDGVDKDEAAPYPSLESLQTQVSEELQLFEKSICDTMERISALAMASVQKKFIGMDAAEKGARDLPVFVTDTKHRIAEKSSLVMGASSYADAVKDNLASEFDDRVRKAYSSFLEQQMTRLHRIQRHCDNMS